MLTPLPSATARLEEACSLDFLKALLYLDSNVLASLLCQRGAQAVRLPLCSPQLGAPSLPFLPDTPTTPLGSAAPRDAAEDALSPFGSNAQRRLAQSSRAPPRLNSIQGARRLPARLPHASPQLGAGAAAAGVGGGGELLGRTGRSLAMEGSNGFGIDSILSHRAGSPALPKGDPLLGDCRSPLELSPRSESSSDCSSPASPGRDCLETGAPRPGGASGPGLDSHLQPGQLSAPAQSRTVTSSFLIRDILADCKPLAACAPYSSSGQPAAPEPGGRLAAKAGEDFREKLDRSSSNASSDSEYKGKKTGVENLRGGRCCILNTGTKTGVHTRGDIHISARSCPQGPGSAVGLV